jgi:GH15 family glucan-1,4-alpha-glucosidase
MKAAATLDLGVIGNGQVAALLAAPARLVWLCLPRFDGDPVFNALLQDPAATTVRGTFDVEIDEIGALRRCYRRNTAVLETHIEDRRGNQLRIIDFCPRFRERGRMFHPSMVIRALLPQQGTPLVRVRIRPELQWGSAAPAMTAGAHHISYRAGDTAFRITTNASITALLEERAFCLREPVWLLLGPDETVEQAPDRIGQHFLQDTVSYWSEWVRGLAIPFEWQEAVIRAAITLKLCTFEDTGAIVAALTTSIPEAADSGRNWDYRYCWLRDSYFVIQELNRLGATRTMESYVDYLLNVATRETGSEIQPLFGISGARRLDEREIDTLAGYRGMGPVRVGNAAYTQRQNDAYGSIVLAATHSFFDRRLARPGDAALFRSLEEIGERAVRLALEPDAGPWELRGSTHVHTFPAVMCWAACDRLARIARRLDVPERADYWARAARSLQVEILERAWRPQRGTRHGTLSSLLDGERLDATLLLLPELGFLPHTDPRMQATFETVSRELRRGSYLMRYTDGDDFGAPQNAFLVASFWFVNALADTGQQSRAREVFEELLSRRTPLGLLSEHLDPASGELWGNFPQTFSMVGILSSARRLSASWGRACEPPGLRLEPHCDPARALGPRRSHGRRAGSAQGPRRAVVRLERRDRRTPVSRSRPARASRHFLRDHRPAPARIRPLLQRLLQRRAVAAVPLPGERAALHDGEP